eukprot:3200321-Prymnesium_polylepis.1
MRFCFVPPVAASLALLVSLPRQHGRCNLLHHDTERVVIAQRQQFCEQAICCGISAVSFGKGKHVIRRAFERYEPFRYASLDNCDVARVKLGPFRSLLAICVVIFERRGSSLLR